MSRPESLRATLKAIHPDVVAPGTVNRARAADETFFWELPLVHAAYAIGRAPSRNYHDPDDKTLYAEEQQIKVSPNRRDVARLHAVIRFEGGQFVLLNKSSHGLTFINEKKIDAPSTLGSGDSIGLGNAPVMLLFVILGRAAARVELTRRELEVLQQLALGKSNRDIADLLGLSIFTVNNHVQNIFSKLGVENRVEAINAARRQHLLL